MSFLSSGGDDDDDFLFSGSNKGGKKLADVFKSDGPAPKEKLTYDRPKPPSSADSQRRGSSGSNTPQPSATAASTQPAVIYFQGVQLFKYESGKQTPTPLGKVGAAVLHTQSSNKWTLLLYYTPQKPITTTSLSAELKWSVTLQGTEHWGQLTDDAAQSWAIHFPTRDECESLSAQLALAQWCAAKSEALGTLDLLVPGKGHAIEAGDLVGIRYSAWTSAQNKIGTKYESNTDKERPLRFEVGKGSVLAGLDRGVLGMKRGQRRVLVLPAALGYGDKGLAPHVTANMTLVFVVELEKMKKSGTSSASEVRAESSASDELQAPLPSLPSVEVLSSSPTSALVENSPEDKAKSKLMERISKLGVPTMSAKPVTPVSSSPPQSTAASVEPQSAAQPEVSAVPSVQPYVPPAQPLLAPTQPQPMYHTAPLAMNAMSAPQHGSQMVLSSQYSAQGMYPPQLSNAAPYGLAPHTMAPQPNSALLMPQPQHALSTSEMVQLLVDERQYKVELKNKIDTMSSKLEQLSDKIDAPQRGRDIGGFTPRNLLDLIQKMVLENERLAVDVEEKSRHVTLLRENINQLHERNQRVVDENSKWSQERVQLAQLDQVREERNRLTQELQLSVQEKNKLQREFLQLQSEKIKVEEDLASANETIEAAARKVQSLKRAQQGLEDQVRTLTDEREREHIERESLKSTIDALNGEHKKYELKIREEQSRAKSLQQELEARKAELEEERDNHERTVKLVEENKRKYITEIKKREAAFDEEKSSLEQQIEDLRATLKKERTASGTLSKEQLERVEQECEHKWQAVLTSREAESRQKLAHTVEEYESTLQSLKDQRAHDQHKIAQLQDTVRQLQEQRAAEPVVSAVNAEQGTDQLWQARLTRAVKAERQRSAEDMTSAVKSIMNNVYINLTQQFDEQAEYDTASVLATIKRVVVQTTLEVLQQQKEQQERDVSEAVEEESAAPPVPATVHEDESAQSESTAVEHESPALDQSTLPSAEQAPDRARVDLAHSDSAPVAEHSGESDAERDANEDKHEEPSPSNDESAPSNDESAPSNDETAPSNDETAPSNDEPAPSAVEQTTEEQPTMDSPEHSAEEQSLAPSASEQAPSEHSALEPSVEQPITALSAPEPSTLEQSTLEHSSLGESDPEPSALDQSSIDQSSNNAQQSTLEQSTLEQSAVENKQDASLDQHQSATLEQSALDEARDDAPKHDVVEVEGDLKASLDQAMLSSQFGTSTALEPSALPDERANPLEASMLPVSEEDRAFAERDNDLLTSTLQEGVSPLEQSAIESNEEPKESEEEINMFEAAVEPESKSEPADPQTENEETSANKETDENIQVPQGHSIEDYKEEEEPQEKLDETPVEVQIKTPVVQSPASRPSSAKKSLFDDDDDDGLFSKIPVKKDVTPKKNSLFDDDDDLFK